MTIRTPVVLHVLEAVEGGTARHVVDLVTHAKGVRHVVAIPAERVGGNTDRIAADRMRAAGADVRTIDMRRNPAAPANLRAQARLLRLARATNADVIHGHSSVGGALARVTGALVRRPVVWTPNGVMDNAVVQRVERALGRVTDHVIAVSGSEAAVIEQQRLARPGHLSVIPNAIEVDLPAPRTPSLRAQLGLGPDDLLVGCIARPSTQKAPEVLVAAWERVHAVLPDAILVWIGDGPQGDVVAAAADRLPSLRWIRALPDAPAYLADLDLFVLSSRYEGAPYAPLEAMRAGVPVLLTDVVGNRDAVVDGKTGVLVRAEDPTGLADQMILLLQDAGLRARLGEAGRDEVRGTRDVTQMAAATVAVYQRLVMRDVTQSHRDRAPNGVPPVSDDLSQFGHPRETTARPGRTCLPPQETQ